MRNVGTVLMMRQTVNSSNRTPLSSLADIVKCKNDNF